MTELVDGHGTRYASEHSSVTVVNSGQTKQIFGRNTETKTRPPGKAEIMAETKI